MNKRVVQRLLETFFRRWWLYLLPLALFAAVGVLKGVNSGSGYRSTGVIDVSRGTLLSQLTSIRGENFGYETPANSTAGTMNSLLRTDQFMEEIARGAGVGAQLDSGELTADRLRLAISAAPATDTLLSVQATTDDPQFSARLAQATIDSFVNYVVAGDVSESKAAEAFFTRQLEDYQAALEQARADLQAYADSHAGGPEQTRPLAEQIEIQRLTSAVNQAEAQFLTAQQKSEEARLATEQAASDVTQRLRIVDQPEVPTRPEPRFQTTVMTVAVFVIVGLLLSFGAVVLGTVMDRSMRSADDVEQLLGLSVLAVVPESRLPRKARHRKGTAPIKASVSRPSSTRARSGTGAKAITSASAVDRGGRKKPGRGANDVDRDEGADELGDDRDSTLGLAGRTPRGGTSL